MKPAIVGPIVIHPGHPALRRSSAARGGLMLAASLGFLRLAHAQQDFTAVEAKATHVLEDHLISELSM
jgi:hypothetical protein